MVVARRQRGPDRARVRILTVDPSTRRVDGGLRDGGVIQITVITGAPLFRWPKEGETWTVQRANNAWVLDGLVQNMDSELPIEELDIGSAKVEASNLYNEAGARFLTDQDVIPGSGDKTFVHNQTVASDTWTIDHTLAKYPSVSVVDSSGDEVETNIHYTDDTQVVLTFSAAFGGKAYLN